MRMRSMMIIIIVLACAAGAQAQKLTEKKALNLAIAKQLAAVAENEAAKDKLSVAIAIVDDRGILIFLETMDETQLASIRVAQEKAYSAIAYKRPTKTFQEVLAQGRTSVLKLPGVIATAGGIPLVADGKIIGAIGVSGGNSEQDEAVAEVGAGALAKILAQ